MVGSGGQLWFLHPQTVSEDFRKGWLEEAIHQKRRFKQSTQADKRCWLCSWEVEGEVAAADCQAGPAGAQT